MTADKLYVITRDDTGSTIYFIRLGLGIFWECSSDIHEARKFTKRGAAAKVLIQNGKHRQGWRVIPVSAGGAL